MTTLAQIAPRLALARDQFLAFERQRELTHLRLLDELLDAERILAHRDLQLVRSGAKNHWRGGHRAERRYLEERAAKLLAAEQRVARIRRQIAENASAA